jgi:Protein of unknown function (DUF3592)
MPGTTRDIGSPAGSEGGGIAPPLLAELEALVSRGALIDAIKRYRFATGAGLVEAKQVVDALAAGRAPGSTPPPISGGAWQVQASVPFTLAKAAGVLRLLAAFLWLCMLLAAGAAAWGGYDRHVVSTAWPEVEAQTVKCKAAEYHGGKRRIDLWTMKEAPPSTVLACTFRYGALGRQYTGETRSHSTDRPALVAAMHDWVARHPPGTTQRVRYDPADPQRISLGDADLSFEADTPEHRIDLAVLFGAVGILFFGGGRWVDAIRRRREAAAGGPI